MAEAYWQIGRLIVDRQGGATRAEYGDGLVSHLSVELSREFGKSFDARELRRMRQFFVVFQNRDALRPELDSWGDTPGRVQISVDNW